MKQETQYIRKRTTIHNLKDHTTQTFKSISLAKKESFKLQKAAGGLGLGLVQLENKNAKI